jgi:flagellar M-ring protein FliF
LEGISKFFSNFSIWFSELNTNRKVLVLSGVGLFLGGLLVMSLWVQKPEYQVLFSKLAQEDAAKIVEKLKGEHVPYKLEQGGGTIMVPTDKVHELRLKLAGEGLPSGGGGVGFEIFDQPSLGMTEFIQNLNFKRGLEGELARTIIQLEEIESARVHIAIPKKSLFMEKEQKPTASVVLKIKSNRKLKDGQVDGIANLVASSVEELASENVTIIDMHGNILSNGRDEGGLSSLTRTQIEYQRGIEKNMEDRARSMLESILGTGKAIVRVSALINFEQVEKQEELFDPDSQVARSEQRTEESNVGSAIPTGIPGPVSNVPGATGAQESAPSPTMTPPSSTKTMETLNYELNKTVKKVVEQVGNVKKLSIAVIVDGTYVEEGEGEKKTRKYANRSEEEMKRLKLIVERAIGLDPARGDTIEVANAPFDTSAEEVAKKALDEESKKELWYNLGRYGVTAFLVLLLVLFLIKPLMSWVSTIGDDLEALRPAPLVEEVEEVEGRAKLELAAIPQTMEYRKMISEYATQDPQHTAELVRKWLKEKR